MRTDDQCEDNTHDGTGDADAGRLLHRVLEAQALGRHGMHRITDTASKNRQFAPQGLTAHREMQQLIRADEDDDAGKSQQETKSLGRGDRFTGQGEMRQHDNQQRDRAHQQARHTGTHEVGAPGDEKEGCRMADEAEPVELEP